MMGKTTFAVALLLAAGIGVQSAGQAFARGGGSNLLMSPGYQRALEESRRRRQAEPYLKPPEVYPHKKWRHRGRRH